MSVQQRKYEALPVGTLPRGLCREAAARYVGISPTKFDEMIEDGRMPGPKKIDSRRVWDRSALDTAFDELPGDGEINPWDKV
jgi:predicted DNA-binding transcriptional regulator AlpA